MAKLSPETIDIIVPEEASVYRHLYFAHFVLGERWPTAFQIAQRFQGNPLSIETMRLIADDWSQEGWGWSERDG